MKKIFIILPLVMLVLSGCIINVKTTGISDGGVFKSSDLGDHWQQTTLIYTVGDVKKSFNQIDASVMVMDPSDNRGLYFGTKNQGMYYSFDGGIGWQQTLTGKGAINDIAISPKEKCIIYVAISNQVYKSSDCNRHWEYKLIETRQSPENKIVSLAIDNYDTRVIYAGTSGGGLFISEDAGYSWRAIKFFDTGLVKIIINPNDNRILYAATASKGIYKTADKGLSWNNIFTAENIKSRNHVLAYRDLVFDPTSPDGLLYASQYGLLRSKDGGQSWSEIKLLTPPSSTTIHAIAVNPKNDQQLYYGTATALYRSEDGGLNWITRNLPSNRSADFLLVDFANPNTLYLAVSKQ